MNLHKRDTILRKVRDDVRAQHFWELRGRTTFLKSRICRRDWLISTIQEPKFKVYSIFLWETNLEFLKN
jgi:hypothetical protein